jgi:hypothetical protein
MEEGVAAAHEQLQRHGTASLGLLDEDGRRQCGKNALNGPFLPFLGKIKGIGAAVVAKARLGPFLGFRAQTGGNFRVAIFAQAPKK